MKKTLQDDLNSPEDLLRKKLVVFQREIADLKRVTKEQREGFLNREQEFLADLFEVLDAFDNLEKNAQQQAASLNRPGRRFMKNVQAIHRKLLRLLSSRQVESLEPAGGRAQIEQCRVVGTRKAPGRNNEEILSVEKKGYVDRKRNIILRKAEVVTVRNE